MANLFGRISRFLRQVWSELRKVIWPTRQQTILFTGIVFLAVAIVAGMIWAADLVLNSLLLLVIPAP